MQAGPEHGFHIPNRWQEVFPPTVTLPYSADNKTQPVSRYGHIHTVAALIQIIAYLAVSDQIYGCLHD